ncbi:hypothetical protein PDL03_19105 [Bacillus cereus]|nr:hypothetical protein [Bacillus cereus]HDX9713538.1 hypothetical protein [Bacillus cereus]
MKTVHKVNKTFFHVLINPLGNGDSYIIESEILNIQNNLVQAKFLFDVFENTTMHYTLELQPSIIHNTPEEAFKFLLSNHFDKLTAGNLWLFATSFRGGVEINFKEMVAMVKSIPGLEQIDLETMLDEIKSKSIEPKEDAQQICDSLKTKQGNTQYNSDSSEQKIYSAAQLLDLPLGEIALGVSGPLKDSCVTKNENGHFMLFDKAFQNTYPLHFGTDVLQSHFVIMQRNKKFKRATLRDALACYKDGGKIKISYKNTERFIKHGDSLYESIFHTIGSEQTIVNNNSIMFSLDELLSAQFYILSE